MPDIGPEPDGATPLEPEELTHLLPTHLTTRAELNEWEQANITKAVRWAARARPAAGVLSQEFLKELHRRMFDGTWAWAGKYRQTGKNIGVSAETIPRALQDVLDDVSYWVEHRTFSLDEIGVRFHHRLVSVHPFPNGNGRHSRLAADVLMARLGAEPFTWGQGSRDSEGESRAKYIAALRRADAGDYGALIKLARV